MLLQLILAVSCVHAERIEVPYGDKKLVAEAAARAKPGDEVLIKGLWSTVGITAKVLDIWPVVDSVMAGSSAEKAGVKPGEEIRAVDGLETLGMGLPGLSHFFSGKPGVQVRVSLRDAVGQTKEVLLRRDEAPILIKDDADRGLVALYGGDLDLVYRYCKPLARAGDARAQSMLGDYYTNLKPRNEKEANAWYTKAAEQGGTGPMRIVGNFHKYGGDGSIRKDDAEAFKWYLKAAEAGDMEAMFLVGEAYRQAQGVVLDGRKAAQWYRKAVDLGHPTASSWLALAYDGIYGATVDKTDKREAHRLYCLAALRGAFGISSTIFYGEEGRLAKDDPLAVAALRAKALQAKTPEAKFRLGLAYFLGETGTKDFKEAAAWFKAGADEGGPEAMNAYGWLLATGTGLDADPAQAIEWFKKVPEQAYAAVSAARNNLGWLYFNGEGVDKDEAKAREFFLKACAAALSNHGNPAGCYHQGLMYETGLGGAPKSDYNAFEKYKDAAKAGDPWAQVKAAQALELGRGASPDPAAAVEWYRKAANQGRAAAQLHMGRLYENGIGVSKDAREAAKWYKRAAQGGEGAEAGFVLRLDPEKPSGGTSGEDLAALRKAAAQKAARVSPSEPRPEAAAASDVDKPRFHLPERPDDFAMVVGVETYAHLPPARFAERDAAAVRDYFLALGVPRRNLLYLTGADASRAGLVKNLETWLPLNVKPGSRVYFYFSGHGAPDPETGQAFLIPSDGDAQFLKDTAYPLKRLYEKLGALKAARVVAALDSCFSGAGGRSVLPKGARPLVTVVDEGAVTGDKLVVLTAAGAKEISGTYEEEGHGLFTYYLLKGLNADAVSVGSLHKYLQPKVLDEARRQNRSQTPQLMPETAAAAGLKLR